jgi:CheY-like chemotaxis protein
MDRILFLNLTSIKSTCKGSLKVQTQKILIVDDEELLADLMAHALQLEGYSRVERASNGEEGIKKYKTFMPDLVIMDIHMPVMDGYESSHKIKAFDPCARILVLTGNPGDSRAIRTLQEGIALSLLQKPLRLQDLTRIVRQNLTTEIQ